MSFPVNSKVVLAEDLYVFNVETFLKGSTGTVTSLETNEDGLLGTIRMDEKFEGLREYNNKLYVYTEDAGECNWSYFKLFES